jgi:Holliday junction resolvase RusA-like endonuclease
MLNANSRQHSRGKAATVKAWRDAAHVYAQAAKLPQLGRARITATMHFPDKRRRDDHNYFPTVKACIDGLVDYGVLSDDSREFLVGTTICGGDPIHHSRVPVVVLLIQEVV